MQNMPQSRSDLDYQVKLFSRRGGEPWLIVAVCILLGALIGGFLSLFLTPIYEAKALVTTNMELRIDGTITEIMLDAQVNHIGELVFHPDVVSRLIDTEATQGNALTLEDLKQKTGVERQLMNTVIKVKDPDPQMAARIASEWAEILYDRLTEAYPHAVRLSEAKLQYEALSTCFSDALKPPEVLCLSLTPEALSKELERLNAIILEESPQSLGLTLAVNVSQYQPAAVPAEPLNFQRGTLILGGAGVGLIVGIFLNEIPSKLKKNDEA
jgi:hypothetical protein